MKNVHTCNLLCCITLLSVSMWSHNNSFCPFGSIYSQFVCNLISIKGRKSTPKSWQQSNDSWSSYELFKEGKLLFLILLDLYHDSCLFDNCTFSSFFFFLRFCFYKEWIHDVVQNKKAVQLNYGRIGYNLCIP